MIVVLALKLVMLSISFHVIGAYVYARTKKHVIVKFPPHLARILIRVVPEFEKYIAPDGCVYCDLLGALYGTIEAAKLWYDHMCAMLIRLGFVVN